MTVQLSRGHYANPTSRNEKYLTSRSARPALRAEGPQDPAAQAVGQGRAADRPAPSVREGYREVGLGGQVPAERVPGVHRPGFVPSRVIAGFGPRDRHWVWRFPSLFLLRMNLKALGHYSRKDLICTLFPFLKEF